MGYDVIVRDGLWFDGTGRPPQPRTLGIRDGVVAAVSAEPLDEAGCPEVIDAAGKWVVRASSMCTPTTTPRCCWTRIAGIGAARRHHGSAGKLFAVDRVCRLGGRRRPVQQGRSGAARICVRRAEGRQDLVDGRRIRCSA
ncbi:hypothetical protein I552_4888 [Mycobacterium xenopi 3993]|nr:hypothetical protein I552_4888 [Mycobacterium xenopi 3993]